MIVETKDQAIQHLLTSLPEDDIEFVKMTFEEDVVELMSSLGEDIIREFDLNNNIKLLENCCSNNKPVNAAFIIMKEMWNRLQNKEIYHESRI